MEETEIAAALPKSNHNFFVRAATAKVSTASATANIGFIHLDGTVHHWPIYLRHGSTDAMAEIPSGFVRALVDTPDSSFELHGAHTFFGFTQQQYRDEPERQREMGIVKDRTAGGGELIFAANALIAGVLFQSRDAGIFATRTGDAFGPAESFQKFSASVISRIEGINFGERHEITS
jgi:hypothetical protein